MKRLTVTVVPLAFILVVGLLASAFWVNAELKVYDKQDVAVFTVLLPEGRKAGLLRVDSGKWVIPPQFEHIDKSEGFFGQGGSGTGRLPLIVEQYDKWGLADLNGKLIAAPRFDSIYEAGERLFRVKMDGKHGLINETGNTVLALDYELVDRFREGLAVVKRSGKFGYVDKSGKVVIEPQYDAAWNFQEGLAMVLVDGKRGYIDKQGNRVISPQFDQDLSGFFSEGMAAVKVNKKWGYIDATGKFLIEPQFMEAQGFVDGVAVVSVPYRGVGLINKSGEFVIEPKYFELENNPGSLIMIVDSKDYGKTVTVAYADKKGRLLTPWFENGWAFAEGRAKVKFNGKFGFIDETGKMIIPPIYNSADRAFRGGVIHVELDGYKGYIDKTGKKTKVEQAYPRYQLVREYGGFYGDDQGNLADHYANHMLLGYKYLETGQYSRATEEFHAALRINPGDEAALYGLKKAK